MARDGTHVAQVTSLADLPKVIAGITDRTRFVLEELRTATRALDERVSQAIDELAPDREAGRADLPPAEPEEGEELDTTSLPDAITAYLGDQTKGRRVKEIAEAVMEGNLDTVRQILEADDRFTHSRGRWRLDPVALEAAARAARSPSGTGKQAPPAAGSSAAGKQDPPPAELDDEQLPDLIADVLTAEGGPLLPVEISDRLRAVGHFADRTQAKLIAQVRTCVKDLDERFEHLGRREGYALAEEE